MTAIRRLEHKFVEVVPSKLETGILYVSIEYTTMIHLCCCGCGNEVVTPLSPNDWKMTFDGKTVSVHPSVGSWSLPCRSHYIINHGRVNWASDWTNDQIAKGRAMDQARKGKIQLSEDKRVRIGQVEKNTTMSFWKKFQTWIRR